MKALGSRVLIGFVVGLVVGAISGAVLLGWITAPKPVNLARESNWLVVCDYHGVLDPAEGKVDLIVRAISRWSGEGGSETIQQNTIEIKRAAGTEVFVWPDRRDFAGGRCQIADLDGDGRKELALLDNARNVRVVSDIRGHLRFRVGADELLALWGDHEISDLDGDGRFEFISAELFPKSSVDITVQIPHVMRWSSDRGFEDVSAQFPLYYLRQFLPSLRDKLDAERDGQMRIVYSRAIAYVQDELCPKITTPTREEYKERPREGRPRNLGDRRARDGVR